MQAFVFALFLVVGVAGAHDVANVTLDDSSSNIRYFGKWIKSTLGQSPLNYGGAHAVTALTNATAVIPFDGVAVYFMSPKWPFDMKTQLRLDNGPLELVDLTDRTRAVTPNARTNATESLQSQVVWSKKGLSNTAHSLHVSVPPGYSFAIVDAVIYTTLTGDDLDTPLAPSSASSDTKKSNVLAIALGSVGACIGVILISLAAFFYRRHRRRQEAQRVANWAQTKLRPLSSEKYGVPSKA
ncbi:hypothetical protein HGRIS_010249 [Hohenbuehelia grisea]|uniref:Uncharacterized protein n=1 Tax=Hohenbuehelia grisea TaxID=104357 RepID=A0ABR3J3Q1_9AGAR